MLFKAAGIIVVVVLNTAKPRSAECLIRLEVLFKTRIFRVLLVRGASFDPFGGCLEVK